jgi:CRP-like cAMP-binding protein
MLESIQEDVDTESHDCETQARPHLINLDDSDTEEAHDSCGDDTDQLPKDVSNTQDCLQSWDLGPNQIFGDMTILTGSPHIGAEAHASVATKVLVLPRHEVTRLLAINSSVREFASEEAVRQLKEVEELKHLPEHCLAALSARSSHRRFEPGDYIFKGTVDDRTPLICIILGSVERIYHKSTKSEILQPGSVLCTEQLKGKSSKAFTAVAVGQTSVLFLQRSVIDEVSKMSMHSLGDSLGWNGAVSNDDSFSKKTRFWKIYDSKKKDRAHGGSGSDDDATDGGTVLSTITDEEIADVHGASFDEPPMDPWMAAMMNVMQNVHERAMTEKGMSKRQERKEQEARVEKRVSELRAKASRTALNEDGKTQAPSGVATTRAEEQSQSQDSKEAAKNSDAGGHGHGHGVT